jgi:hypothetical protein
LISIFAHRNNSEKNLGPIALPIAIGMVKAPKGGPWFEPRWDHKSPIAVDIKPYRNVGLFCFISLFPELYFLGSIYL